MCILCVIQKWSRRVATMLPWLVIPLIGLWLLSQLLPPAFRFEITSPRLACVFVLLVTLFWYEILMPQLSAWRVRRNAWLREKKRSEAIELQKLRKTATRKCRNCLTPYRDQNPGGGKFMCSYCGHVSKRPVLDLPVPPGTNSGILKDLVGKGVRMFNGKVWSDMCGQDWLENGNWVGIGGSFGGKSSFWRNPSDGGGLFGGRGDDCLAEKSYNRILVFACKLFATFLFCLLWLWRKLFRISSSARDESSSMNVDRGGGGLDKSSQNGGTFYESRGEKARRKAEEKRQAKLEKEQLVEEERKQREEVARLVEERRKLRDEKMEAEKGHHVKRSPPLKGSDSKKETEKKRHEKKKERDRGSSKSNSDVEELEKRASKESERNKKGDCDRRENHRTASETVKVTHGNDVGHAFKGTLAHNHSRGSIAGNRYFDCMKGTFLSSRAFTGGGFFRKSSYITASRETKSSPFIDQVQIPANKREIALTDRVSAKPTSVIGEEKNIRPPGPVESQPSSAPKKSWQQLFTRSNPPATNSNVISRPSASSKVEVNNPFPCSLPSTSPTFDNPVSFGLSSPLTLPSFPPGLPNNSSTGFLPSLEAMFSQMREKSLQFLPEESEIFEDPCYDPDPVSLLGPVSESLDNFQLDLGFMSDTGLETPSAVKSFPLPAEVSRPSPIESPISRFRIPEERHTSPFCFQGTSRPLDLQHNPVDGYTNLNEARTYQMWDSDQALGLSGGPASWVPAELNRPKNEDILHSVPVSQKAIASHFKKDDHVCSSTHSSQNVLFGSVQSGGAPHSSSMTVGNDGSWFPKTFSRPNPGSEDRHFSFPKREAVQNSKIYGSPSGNVTSHLPEVSAANSWEKNERNVQSSGGVSLGNTSLTMKPHIGGLYSTPDVQSLWSYDKEKRI